MRSRAPEVFSHRGPHCISLLADHRSTLLTFYRARHLLQEVSELKNTDPPSDSLRGPDRSLGKTRPAPGPVQDLDLVLGRFEHQPVRARYGAGAHARHR